MGSEISWHTHSAGIDFPEDAVRAGTDSDGTPIFVGRANHEGDLIPAKVMPDRNYAYIAYGGKEIETYDFEILCCPAGTFAWEYGSNGSIPSGAVEIGKTRDDETLYYGRSFYAGSQTPGKIHVSHGCLYIPYGGQEVKITDYEVLVYRG